MYNTTRYVSAVRSDLGFRSADPAGCISTTATACALPMMSLGWWASWAGARLDEVPGAVVELEAVAPGGGVQHLRLHGHPRAPRRQAGLQLAVQILQRRLQGTTEFVILFRAPSVVYMAGQTPPSLSPDASPGHAVPQCLHLDWNTIATTSRWGFYCFGPGIADGRQHQCDTGSWDAAAKEEHE